MMGKVCGSGLILTILIKIFDFQRIDGTVQPNRCKLEGCALEMIDAVMKGVDVRLKYE